MGRHIGEDDVEFGFGHHFRKRLTFLGTFWAEYLYICGFKSVNKMKKFKLRTVLFSLVIFASASSFAYVNIDSVGAVIQENMTDCNASTGVPQAHPGNHVDIEIVKGFFVLIHKFLPAS